MPKRNDTNYRMRSFVYRNKNDVIVVRFIFFFFFHFTLSMKLFTGDNIREKDERTGENEKKELKRKRRSEERKKKRIINETTKR